MNAANQNGVDTRQRRRHRAAGLRRLTRAEEVVLARRIERGDLRAKQKLVESNLGLVHMLAGRYRVVDVPFADLVQEGTVGLVRAAERFDYRRGLKFSTYAVWWIRRSILDAIADARVIRIPAKASRQLAAIQRAEAELTRIRARRPTEAEIAEHAQLKLVTVRSLRAAARVTGSLDEPVGDRLTPLGDRVGDQRAVDPSESAIAGECRRELSVMLRRLPERHREVIIRRYGLKGTPQSHKAIGKWLGVGEERSRQIEREALHRLRSIAAVSATAPVCSCSGCGATA
jgi:RNA polymerase primary sigma factor